MKSERVEEYFRRWPKPIYNTEEDAKDPEGEASSRFILESTREEQHEIFKRMGVSEKGLKSMFPEFYN